MLTDYKFWYIFRDDDGFITEAGIRFYEGEMQARVNKQGQNIQEYVRTRRLSPKTDLNHLAKKIEGRLAIKTRRETTGNEAVVYHATEFGKIKTDDELRAFLNSEIEKDITRSVINEQKVTK